MIWIFGLLLLQGILSYFQVKDYRKNVSAMNKKGDLFIGQVKGRIRAGSIVLMAIDKQGNILEAKSMTGITVFHRFKDLPQLIGFNIDHKEHWLNKLKNKQMIKAIEKGIEVMNNQKECNNITELPES